MPLTHYKGFSPSQSQQFAAQSSMDPANSPLGRLRGDLPTMMARGLDPMQVEQQYQAGLSQAKYAAEKPAGMDAISERYGAYGKNIPSMRNNLLKLPNTRAQY